MTKSDKVILGLVLIMFGALFYGMFKDIDSIHKTQSPKAQTINALKASFPNQIEFSK